MYLYLIRHGEVKRVCHEPEDYFYCLTESGRKGVADTGVFLKNSEYSADTNNIILTSETLRTIETSTILSHILKTKIRMVPNCQELDMGFNDGKEKKDWKYVYEGEFTDRKGFDYAQKWVTRHYLGESPKDVYDRLETLKECILSLKDHNVYVVGHGASLRLLDMKLNPRDIEWYYEEPIPEFASV